MKTYYHVSRDIHDEIDVFEPKVPSTYLVTGEENRNIKRVCLAEGFMDCMNAVNYLLDKDVYDDNIQLYKPMKVYRFELDESKVIQPEEVYRHGVHDALINKECWSTEVIRPVESFIITPTYIGRSDKIPYHIAYMDFEKGYFPYGLQKKDD